MTVSPAPPFTPLEGFIPALRSPGYAVMQPQVLSDLLGLPVAALCEMSDTWNDLPPDGYLRDGGRYRRRRHACYVAEGDQLRPVPHRAHWQPLDYNALHGGLERWFEPLSADVAGNHAWQVLLLTLAAQCSVVKGPQPWFVEAHQFRIDTEGGIGRPTPEGAHRDGVDFVAVILVDRVGVKGGETRVFEAQGCHGQRFTLLEPWTLLMLDDEKVIHESTPIQPIAGNGHRDTLVLTFRAGGFQGPDSS
ncbi:MAG: 2OG-Fe dioxygenase family protein [Burkholderiales bacterium]